jgi:hypothetical protein
MSIFHKIVLLSGNTATSKVSFTYDMVTENIPPHGSCWRRQGALPHEALELIMTKHGIEFKGKVIEAFVNSIPSYIPGTKVLLSNNQKGIVSRIQDYLHRPVVRLFDRNEEINLAENPSILVKEILD